MSNVDFPKDFASLYTAQQILYKFLSFWSVFQSLLFPAMLLKEVFLLPFCIDGIFFSFSYLGSHCCPSTPTPALSCFLLLFHNHLALSQFHPPNGHVHIFYSVQKTEGPPVIGKHSQILLYPTVWRTVDSGPLLWVTSVVSCIDQRSAHVLMISFPIPALSWQYILSKVSFCHFEDTKRVLAALWFFDLAEGCWDWQMLPLVRRLLYTEAALELLDIPHQNLLKDNDSHVLFSTSTRGTWHGEHQ